MRRLLITLCLVFAPLLGAAPMPSVQPPNGAAAQPVQPTPAELQQHLDEALAAPALDEASRQEIDRLFRVAIGHATESARFRLQAQEAPTLLASIREELSQPLPPATPLETAGLSLADMEQRLADANAQLAASREQLTELQGETDRRQARRTEIPTRIAELRRTLDDLNDRRASLPATPTDDATTARVMTLEAERAAIRSEIDKLEAELSSYDARRDLLPARRDRAARRVTERERAAGQWLSEVNSKRQSEAEAAARAARQTAARQHPALRAFAQQTQFLAEKRAGSEGLPQRINELEKEIAEAGRNLSDLRAQYQSLRPKLDVSGLNKATGVILRGVYERLEDPTVLRKRESALRQELEEAEYEVVEQREARQEAADTTAVADEMLDDAREDPDTEVTPEMETAARELAAARRDLLDQLVTDAEDYADRVERLARINGELLAATEAFVSFIEERILWVRSISGSRLPTPSEIEESIDRVSSIPAWRTTLNEIRSDVNRRWPLTAFVIIGLAAIIVASQAARRRFTQVSERVARYKTDTFTLTIAALALVVIIAAPVPAVLWWIGWLISRPINQDQLGISIGLAFQYVGGAIFPLLIVKRALRRHGLAEVHFRWPTNAIDHLRRHLRWFIPTIGSAIGVVVAAESFREEAISSALGRAGFLGVSISSSVFFALIFRRSSPSWSEYVKRNASNPIMRMHPVWFALLTAGPIALAVIAMLGYHYSALALRMRYDETLLLVLGLILANSLLLRWLYITRRRVAVEQARRKREQAQADVKAAASTAGPTEGVQQPVDEMKVDLPAISTQTKQLFRSGVVAALAVGLFIIWADVLPALRFLERVQLWPEMRFVEPEEDVAPAVLTGAMAAAPRVTNNGVAAPVDQSQTPAAGSASNATATGSGTALTPLGILPAAEESPLHEDESGEGVRVLTLADLGLAIIALLIAIVAFRNLPGLVEILVLQRLPLDAASRFALTTVLRYAIAFTGLLASATVLGLSWSNLQWLAAALTFGLAFGLQEIFANFISGLIILAERPIRIGDTVTVGEVSGTVTKIRMRATTITDWDRKELVIPNKSFITGEIINWTLTDPTLRLILNVGISYGSDIAKAERTLVEIAVQQPLVLQEPKPYVHFRSFGDSTLDFELRLFIAHIDNLLTVRHEIHKAIVQRFREEGIEIAFPQRDLHLRSADPIMAALRRNDGRDVHDGTEIESR